MTRRTFLFLQGPPTPFWRELAAGFEAQGHRVRRVLLCPGDRLHWRGPAIPFRGGLDAWPATLNDLVRREGVTDFLVYGDQTPYHRAARDLARSRAIGFYALEFGYLRPGWLTLERGGHGAWSHLPDDPAWISAAARSLPEPPDTRIYAHAPGQEAFAETSLVVANALLRPLFPRYDPDRSVPPLLEYASTVLRWGRAWRDRGLRAQALARASSGERTFVLLPLQLQTDAQIRRNSPFADQRDMLADVMASFARHAPADLDLLVKVHPLDVGLIDWPATVATIAERHGVAHRVATVDGGDLAALLQACRGVVLINSTVGLHAIRAGRPVKVLGIALYDLPGLTHQGPLADFWERPEPVDPTLARDFVRVLARTIQVPGSFYETQGRRTAVVEIVRRILADEVNAPDAFRDPPPRLERARRLGVPV